MDGKAANFILQIDRNHPIALVLGGLHVYLETLLLQIGDGDVNLVRAHSQVSLLTQVLALHHLDAGGREDRAVAVLRGKVKGGTKCIGHFLSRVIILGIDAS